MQMLICILPIEKPRERNKKSKEKISEYEGEKGDKSILHKILSGC